ncbi:hypothetical protein [Streptomyces sp. NPDC000851]
MPEGTDETTVQPGAEEETNPSGTGEEVPQNGDPAGTDNDQDPDGSDALGDAGKRALDSMKAKWREERDRRRALEGRIAALEAPKPSGDSDQPDPDAIRREAAREATSKANARIVRSEIKAAAAGKFADITDVFANIDPTKFEVDDNGDIDADEINDAIEDLLTRKPHLAAKAAPRFQGTGDGGAARKASGPSQLTRDDLKRMSPAEIAAAKRDGRLNKLLGITK